MFLTAIPITVHKSQGSEFPVVVIPLATQHYLLLQRNLVYTGITRGKKLVVLIGQRKVMDGEGEVGFYPIDTERKAAE